MDAIKQAILFWKKSASSLSSAGIKSEISEPFLFFPFFFPFSKNLCHSFRVQCPCCVLLLPQEQGDLIIMVVISTVSSLLTGSSFYCIRMRKDCLTKPKRVCQVSRVQTGPECILKQAKLSSMLQAQITVTVPLWFPGQSVSYFTSSFSTKDSIIINTYKTSQNN